MRSLVIDALSSEQLRRLGRDAQRPATVGELAGRVALAPATTSLLVNELAAAGLVLRRGTPMIGVAR